ncbi:MAG TPA: hypothetical protein VNX21_06415 [Candidatus Thermoplasmatota archaeon]|nr:hypothetical protein [Candidatus Thermoplasmatota archaeon]
MRLLVPLLLVVATLPHVAAQSANGCGGGVGALSASCTFTCRKGQRLDAELSGYGFATARCGGAAACSLGALALCGIPSSTPTVVQYNATGTCQATGYVWLSYACTAF